MTSSPASFGTYYVGPTDDPDRYVLGPAAGAGAQGILYRARRVTAGGMTLDVAVKMLQPQLHGQLDRWTTRWLDTVEVLHSVRSPGLVAVREGFVGPQPHLVGEADVATRALYIVTNWIEGAAIDEWVAHHPDMPAVERLRLLLPVAAGLDVLHSGAATGGTPVAHRDVKPANILVSEDGGAVLIDFGLARELGASPISRVAGTPGYLAPELKGGGSFTPAADRYALGVVTWQLVTGRTPPEHHDATAFESGLAELAQTEPRLADHIRAMLSAEPSERPSPLSNWCASLVGSTFGDDLDVVPVTATTSRRGGARRLRNAALGLVAILAIVGAGVAGSYLGTRSSTVEVADETGSREKASPLDEIPATSAGAGAPQVSPAVVAGATCRNDALGYSAVVPDGWHTRGGGFLAGCDVFDRGAFDPASFTARQAARVPIYVRSMGPDRTLLSRQYFKNSSPVDLHGHRALRVEEELKEDVTVLNEVLFARGSRSYTYFVDQRPSVLAFQYYAPPGQSAAEYTRGKQALDALVNSVQFSDVGCRDRRDIYCGAFYWTTEPKENGGVTISFDPPQLDPVSAGSEVRVNVTASDPDADQIEISAAFQGPCNPCAAQVPPLGRTGDHVQPLEDVRALWFSDPSPRPFGPWVPPRVLPKTETTTVTTSFPSPGRYTLCASVTSRNSDARRAPIARPVCE